MAEYPGKHRNHPLGDCFYSDKHKLCYVQIPKNASSSIKQSLGWERTNFILKRKSLDIRRYIVVLRDPVERWISATNYFCTKKINPRADEHYELQTYFVGFMDTAKIDFFWYNDNIVEDINDFYDLNIKNRSSYVNKSERYIQLLNDGFVKNMYEDDYNLIATVKFVNK